MAGVRRWVSIYTSGPWESLADTRFCSAGARLTLFLHCFIPGAHPRPSSSTSGVEGRSRSRSRCLGCVCLLGSRCAPRGVLAPGLRAVRFPVVVPGDPCRGCACNFRNAGRCRFDSQVEKIPWKRAWQPLQYSCLQNPMDRVRAIDCMLLKKSFVPKILGLH